VASKKLDDGAWFLLESPVVCWPLTQQEGDWPGCVDFFSGFHSTCSNQNGPRVLSSTYLMVVLHHVRSIWYDPSSWSCNIICSSWVPSMTGSFE
jgi:hypothetical protein